MAGTARYLPVLLLLLAAVSLSALGQEEEAILLVAHPSFRDLDYRQTVVLAAPAPNGGHVGVILNRPTRRSLGSLFPEHEPSKKVVDPVYYGGPFSRGALVALVKTDTAPGGGSVLLMKNLYMAFRANTIDRIIESTPNDARYYVGYIGWRAGELKGEIDRGLWSVLTPDPEVVFRKDMDGLWEEMLQQTRRIRAESGTDHVFQPAAAIADKYAPMERKTWSVPDFSYVQAAAFADAFSNVIFAPR